MKRARTLAAGIGIAAIALGAAALAGPAAAAPTSSPGPSTSATSGSPSSSPSTAPSGSPSASPTKPSTAPSTKPSTSDSPSTGTKPAAPKATVYDMEVAAESDVNLESNGPGTATTSVSVSVHNSGTVTQQGLTITVVEPSDAQLTGALIGAKGIDNCVHGIARGLGLGELTCQVHDSGPAPDRYESARFVLSGQVPLPNEPNTPYGTVTLHGYHTPNANPAGTEVAFEVHATDTSKPVSTMNLVATASTVTMARGSDGLYHGVLRMSVTNRGPNDVPPLTLEIEPPENATVVGPVDALFPWPCGLTNSPSGGMRSLRCQGGGTFRSGQTFSASFRLTATRPTTDGSVGWVRAEVTSDHGWNNSSNANIVQYELTFAATPASASPSGSGQAAGSGSSLPVTGTPLALIAGGGAAVLVAGGALLVLSRRRKARI